MEISDESKEGSDLTSESNPNKIAEVDVHPHFLGETSKLKGSGKKQKIEQNRGPDQSSKQTGNQDGDIFDVQVSLMGTGIGPADVQESFVGTGIGPAAHPRSIVERARRTRISERLKQLRDFLPGSTEYTSNSDILDEAINYVKSLQWQIALQQDLAGKTSEPKGSGEKQEIEWNRGLDEFTKQAGKQDKDNSKGGETPKKYIVKARGGQATNSRSLAEQVRRTKTAEKMRVLQELIPEYNKFEDTENFLVEVSNYVKSLQLQLSSMSGTDNADTTALVNQDSDGERLSVQALELEKKGKGERYSESEKQLDELHHSVISGRKPSPKEILLLLGKDYEFEKEMLIQLWMALGFLMVEPMEAIGANYFEKLVSEGYILCSVANSYKVNTEKLHTALDIVREKQNYVILGNGSQNDDAFTESLHVSVLCDEIDETVFKKLRRFSRLRTLLFLGNYGSRLQQVPRDLFMCYEFLVALDLSGTRIKELPSFTRKMINLRYLDLSWTFIELLPERIDRFQRLQTLKLKGCSHLCRLPKEMKTLTLLRHLDLDVLRQLTAFPKGIGALLNLQTLSAFPVGTEEGLKISELKYLNNLTGEFCIANLENVHSEDEAKEASLIAKRSIKKLELRWSRHHQSQGPKNKDEAILENLCPYSDLEEIQILCYHGTCLPSWISDVSLQKLVSISLMKCENVAILASLEKLPSLKFLELVGLSSVIEMNCGGDVDHVAFPNLQKLAIDGLLNLETWTEAQEGDYPSLVELSIKDCPKLPELPSLFCLLSLEHLEVSGCGNLAFLSEKELSTSLQQLIVEDCPLIKERCSNQKGQDWYKIQHVPTIWIDQVAIQQEYEDDKAPSEEDDESDWWVRLSKAGKEE